MPVRLTSAVGENACEIISAKGKFDAYLEAIFPSSKKRWRSVVRDHTYGDSLHGNLSTRTKKIVADLMMTQDKTVLVYYPDFQWQRGTSDCGAFAIAFATSLCTHQFKTPLK